MKKLNFCFLFLLMFTGLTLSQTENIIINRDYKFSFNLPENISNVKIAETSNKISISYAFEKFIDTDTLGVLLVAFKWKDIKNLSDFIYLMEKEVSFNIPERISDYNYVDSVYYDFKIGEYQNRKMHHTAFFYRTKDDTQDYNYTYMLRFKVKTPCYSEKMKEYMNEISSEFKPIK